MDKPNTLSLTSQFLGINSQNNSIFKSPKLVWKVRDYSITERKDANHETMMCQQTRKQYT